MELPLIPDIEPGVVFTNSYFTPDHRPAVYWQLDRFNGLISLNEARSRAQALLQAVGYAESEAAIVRGMLHLHRAADKRQKPRGFHLLPREAQRQAQHQDKVEHDALVMAAHLREFLKQGRSPLLEGMEVIFGYHSRKALININWYGAPMQLEPYQAAEHAVCLIETAEATESDAYFRWFLLEQVGISIEQAYPMIADFQIFRQRRQLEEVFGNGFPFL